MKLQLKRSNVLELGGAKEPTAAQMEYGELAVNYNNGDPAIFLKDSNDNIIRIAGVGNINSGDTPSGDVLPPTGNQVGDVFFNTTNNTMYYWDGSQWVPIANDVTAADIYVGTLAEIDAEVPANERRNGFLWWNTEDGTLYIWYIDANTSQFVIAIPSTGGGGGGASVAVNNVPPTNANQGDMWWNTTDGRLYIWYQDVDTGQWVDASPDSQVSPITSGENFPTTGLENDMFFNTTDGRLYIYYNDGSSLQWVDASPDSQAAIYWDRTGTTLSPSNDGDNVFIEGQIRSNKSIILNNNLGLDNEDTPAITVVHDRGSGVTNPSLRVLADGTLYLGDKGTGTSFDVDPAAIIRPNGSAQFTNEENGSDPALAVERSGNIKFAVRRSGEVLIGEDALGSPGITLQADGRTKLTSTSQPLTINRDNGNANSYNFTSEQQGTETMRINTGGKILSTSTSIGSITSERRLKENIVPIDSGVAWETIKSTPYYAYNFIGSSAESVCYGPMADEVPAEMVLDATEENEAGVMVARSDDEGPIRTFDNGMLQARLYVALQTALTRIETLEAEVQALKGGN